MPSIMVTNDPAHGRNVINLNWSDIPTVLYAGAIRIDADGNETQVRAHTFVDESGYLIELSAGLAVLYDTEAPLDVPVTYRTEGAGSSVTVTTAASTLDSDGNMWLKSPLHPWADQRVTQGTPTDPACLATSAIFFGGRGAEGRPSRSNSFPVNNRRTPIAASRVRGSIVTESAYVSRSFTDRDNMIALNASGDTLLFQAPPAYGVTDEYQLIGEYTINRLSSDMKIEGRLHQMPSVEVDRPAGLADGVLGVRWMDLCDPYATFGDATAAGLTWTGVLLGLGSTPPSELFRLYSDIPVDFATYADIPAGGRTYEGLAEGD